MRRADRQLDGSAFRDDAGTPVPHRLSVRRILAGFAVATPLVLAIVAGVFGFYELRNSLTFEQRATHAVWLHTHIVRLQIDEETGVRGFAATGDRVFLEPYREAAPLILPELAELRTAVDDLRVPDGPADVRTLSEIHAAWTASIAGQLVRGEAKPIAAIADARTAKALIDRFRAVDRQLGKSIFGVIRTHREAFGSDFLHITLLIVASIVMCAFGIALAAVTLVRVDRARVAAESALREREIFYEQGRVWSQSFQRAVLPPHLPAVAGCRFDAVYEPGESDAHVGGDWYDAVRLVDGRVLVSIGDVAGSGLEAAVVMGVVRQIMRGIAQLHANPALMLDAADRALRVEYSDVFVTAWVGIIDMVTQTLSYASAGHPPVLLANADGAVAELGETALPLGLRQGRNETEATTALTDGATIVLYTDGLTEATRDIVAGDKLVRAAVERIALAPWHDPATQIQRHVLAERAIDDVAILVARFDFIESERYIRRWSFDVRDADAARKARDGYRAVLAERRFPDVETLNAELVFGELIGNVLRHAEGEAQVDLAIDFGSALVVLHVFDRGPGFRHSGRLPVDPYSETGRGLFLIAALTEDFTVVERSGGGSHARAVLGGRYARAAVEALPATAAPA